MFEAQLEAMRLPRLAELAKRARPYLRLWLHGLVSVVAWGLLFVRFFSGLLYDNRGAAMTGLGELLIIFIIFAVPFLSAVILPLWTIIQRGIEKYRHKELLERIDDNGSTQRLSILSTDSRSLVQVGEDGELIFDDEPAEEPSEFDRSQVPLRKWSGR